MKKFVIAAFLSIGALAFAACEDDGGDGSTDNTDIDAAPGTPDADVTPDADEPAPDADVTPDA